MMRKGIDPSKEVAPAEEFTGRDIVFTNDLAVLKEARFFIVAVPTPVDKYNVPDLKPLLSALGNRRQGVEKGRLRRLRIDHRYPGCTEEDCLPRIGKGFGSADSQQGTSNWATHPNGSTRAIRSIP